MLAYFNSIKVQLELRPLDNLAVVDSDFNSIKVQLELNQNLSGDNKAT